ncbi:molybdopterin-containing oxidoreductase family protein [Raoultibacter timonensis]|uniref:molybdopterin-containing oxidoreductase family protein n=1 Tax=Raoultibacter timonensis TaxID=1907662 RepID=UPI0015E18E36|nr:molybdopterin-dependent oxidoreductase [Raoultibacter timonensis]
MAEKKGEEYSGKNVKRLDQYPNNYIDEDGTRWRKGRCFFCSVHCLLYGGVDKNGKLTEIIPLDEQSKHCYRMGEHGEKFIKFHYHPARINRPLKRIGERGEDKWEEISYDQALDEISTKLKELRDEYGPETLVIAEGTYRSDHLWARTRFTNLFGNPSNIIDPGTICWCWTYTLNMSMVGWPIECSVPPWGAEAGSSILWGVRPYENGGEFSGIWRTMSAPVKRKENPGNMVVIDPLCTEEAKESSLWLPIIPGTDLALQLTWINYIIENKLYDEEFLKYWSNAVFLIRKDTKKLVRLSEIEEGGLDEDFVVWDAKRDGLLGWCSDENRYYADGEVDAQLSGEFEITFKNGETVTCITAFDELADRMSQYTVEWASGVTGLTETKIVQSVTAYATGGPAYIGWGLGSADQHGPNGANSGIAKTMLRILTGNIDVRGGEYIGFPGIIDADGEKRFPLRDSEFELSEMVTPEARAKFLGNDEYRLMSWKGFEPIDKCFRKMFGVPRPMLHQLLVTPPKAWDAILTGEPYPVKALIAWSSNPLAWAPNTKHVYKALKALDLLVVVDYWKTPTAALADYIMPAADSLERPMATTIEDAYDIVLIGDKIIEPEYERHVDYDFWRGLGLRCGQEEYWPWETYEDAVAHRLARGGVSYEEAMEEGAWVNSNPTPYKHAEVGHNGQIKGFATPSRKAEIFSSIIQDLDYDPIPEYKELPETPVSQPELAKEYPFRLVTGGRWSPMHHSEFRVPGCGTRGVWPNPIVQLHVSDGRNLGIRDGDWVWIETKRGRIKQVAKLEWGIVRGVVICQPSWWYPEQPAEEPWSLGVFDSNANVLTDDAYETLDPKTGQWVTRGMLCKIYPVTDGTDRADLVESIEPFVNEDPKGFWNNTFNKLNHKA